jgi:hypothetical protein
VVITLVFLLLQVRQSNRNQRSIIQQARSERQMAVCLQSGSPHFSEVSGKVEVEGKALTVPEINIYINHIAALFASLEDSLLQFNAGTLDATSWQADKEKIDQALREPAIRAAWRFAIRNWFAGPYRTFIDDLILQTNGVKIPNYEAMWEAVLAEEVARAHVSASSAS